MSSEIPVPNSLSSTPKRIVIIGLSGSGKTTLAREISQKLGIDHTELDAVHWEPNWTSPPREVYRERVNKALPADGSWVADGNYKNVRDIIWTRAEMIIWLDYPLWFTLWRLFRRTSMRVLLRKKLWNTNQEKFSQLLSKDPEKNIFVFTVQRHKVQTKVFEDALAEPAYQHLKVLHFFKARETKRWLDGFPGNTSGGKDGDQ